jgi:uncharacterized protein YjbI with pentapeptide repeats
VANEDDVDLLKQGKKVWNKWRSYSPPYMIDLSGAELYGAELYGANLSWTDLSGANLTRANLYEANISKANLSGAKLHIASLIGANLSWTDLSGADLTRADFSGANLYKANLQRAKIGQTIFADNDLSAVKELETVQHHGPSTIGVNTIYRSGGNIPEEFLRGAGLPEDFITYLPSLTGRAIEFFSCFISYSHADKSFARRLHDALQGRGIRCWLDEHQILLGENIYTEVDQGIRLWDKVLLCASRQSLTSWWVDREIDTAIAKEQQLWKERGKEVLAIIPLDLDRFMFSHEWESAHTTTMRKRLAADFTGWKTDNQKFEQQFERLVKSLRADSGRKQLPPPPKL